MSTRTRTVELQAVEDNGKDVKYDQTAMEFTREFARDATLIQVGSQIFGGLLQNPPWSRAVIGFPLEQWLCLWWVSAFFEPPVTEVLAR